MAGADANDLGGPGSVPFHVLFPLQSRPEAAGTGGTGRTSRATGRRCSADGYFRILGRIDDVINVAGHRLGAKEIESACLTVPEVAEAAVVPVVDEVKGRFPVVYLSLKPGKSDTARVRRDVTAAIE